MKTQIEQLDRRLGWQWLPELTSWTIEQALAIQQIPAPTFHEAQRAAYVASQFSALNLAEVSIDERYNVYGLLRGQHPDAPGILVLAHTDTVFPADTDLATRVDGGLIYGPGLGDNSIGVAGLLGLARAWTMGDSVPERNIWLVATSREEGLGDLGGIKVVFERLKSHIQQVINVEGLAFGHVYHAGIAVRRLHISAAAEGGHSWLHFGRPSAIHGLIDLGARINALQPPQSPRTTYNIGIIEGGNGINVIASHASFWLDLRSEDSAVLAPFEVQVRDLVNASSTPDLSFSIEVVGDRPAGSISPDHPLVQNALAVLAQLNVAGRLETGSTDGNVPLAAGCPAVTIGITRGGNAHRVDEYIETEPVALGLRQLILLALASAEKSF
ncbi:MAG: M20/M25/M40 family metallo-hydrolase [Burkholderiales bacterium]|nr:M20/M25/M40 family metallo-hydrolase [Anaerolineae bacterium]